MCVLHVTHHLFEGNWNLVNRAIASLSLTAFETEVDSTAVTVGPDSFPENDERMRVSQKDRERDKEEGREREREKGKREKSEE